MRVSEHPSHEDALLAMLSVLTESVALTLPSLDERGISLGDVGFCGQDEEITSLVFVRLNVLVDMRSIGNEPTDILALASGIDRQILASSSPSRSRKEMTMAIVKEVTVGATRYNDLYVRDNFGDSGMYPSTGNPYSSPDIIPRQNEVFTWTTANSTYNGPDQGMAIIDQGINNIYIRAKNLNALAGTGTVGLYYADAYRYSLCQVPGKGS